MISKGRSAFVERVDVSRETLKRLDVYAELLGRWNRKINLVSKRTLDDLWARHFLDSAQLLEFAKEGGSWVDLGSGGGFPGTVVAILAAESRPKLMVTMVEADQRKAAFLRTVLRETGVSADVIAQRIEQTQPLEAEILSARALAPLVDLLGFAERHLATTGRALFLKGEKASIEVTEALERWRFDCETYSSKTDKEAVILSIGDVQRV